MLTDTVLTKDPPSLNWLLAAITAACALVIGLTGLYSWQDYRETVERGEERALLLAGVLDGYTIRTLHETESAMTSLAELHAGGQTGEAALGRYATLQQKRFPFIAALHLLDRSGNAMGANALDNSQALFAWARAQTARSERIVIGEPLVAGPGMPRLIPMLAQVAIATNAPHVLVVAAIRADFLVAMHAGLGLSPDSLSVVLNRQGVILASAPYIESAIGRDLSGSALYRSAARGQKTGVAAGISPADGIDRLMGFSRLSDFPLGASSGFDHARMLAPWRIRAQRDGVVALTLLVLIALLGRIAYARAKGEELARRELRGSEEHHRAALATLAEGVVTQGPDGAILCWNDAALRILDLTPDQLRGRTSLDPRWRAVREDGSEFPGPEHPAMRALATGQPQLAIAMGIDSSGTARRWIEINALPTRAGGVINGVVSSFVDTTAKREVTAEIYRLNYVLEERVATRTEELRRIGLELDELVYSMAHTLRAPLRHISAFTVLLAEEASARLTTDDLQMIGRIRKSAEFQAKLLEDVFNYTNRHRQAPTHLRLAMDEIVDNLIQDMNPRIPGAKHVAWVRTPLPCLLGDPAMVRDILEILLSNAIKFSARSALPRIEIGACEINGMPGIEIGDNGVGFDMRYAGNLFGMFRRLHQSEGFEGTGMSLAVCKRLVERQGGIITAEGRVGHGATFRFALDGAMPPAIGSPALDGEAEVATV